MATVRKQQSRRGRTATWRVEWREGGGRGGAWDGETCDDKTTAENFAALVRVAGHRRPEGYPQGCRGIRPAPAEPSRRDVVTLGQAVGEYFGSLKRADERQVEGYRRLYVNHVATAVVRLLDSYGLPTGAQVGPLGMMPVDQITTEVVEAWVAWMASRTYVYRKARKDKETGKEVRAEVRPYSAKTIHNIHGTTISPALARAARLGKIDANPCASVELPRLDLKAVSLDEVPVGDELAEWIEIGYEVSTLAGDMITIAIGTGLRWSEITALRPCDIDLGRKTLRVAQVIKEDSNRHLYVAPYGKSDSALRTIRIGKSVRKMLKRRCKGLGRKELIFQRPTGGILHSAGFYETHWSKVAAKAETRGLKNATVHKFRHSHATELLAENVSMDTVSKRLGHRSIVITTLLYSHLVPEADERAADVMELRIGGKPKKGKGKKRDLNPAA